MTSSPWLRSLATLCASALICAASGCVLNTDFLTEEGTFFCQADTDCDSTFTCDPNTNACVRRGGAPIEPDCVDKDQDGYGVGEDRRKCPKPEEDTDDNDASIYPGAPDICDGKDNDSDPATPDGQIACRIVTDCPQSVASMLGGFFFCEDNPQGQKVCVLKAANAVGVCMDVIYGCVGGMYEEIPAECR